jgi:SAM-dependent methyltransferase
MEHPNRRSADFIVPSNAVDLNHFIEMLESQPEDKPDLSVEKWNRRAEAWENERVSDRKSDERIRSTVDYLRSRGLLHPGYDIADIGCGPGRFAVEFARSARSVTGFDISKKMVQYGMEHAEREGFRNVRLRTCDFQTLDLEKEGLKGAFDLVFSSLTPAVRGMNNLRKFMEMSRAYCCNITHIYSRNQLNDRIMREVFGREPPARWNGRWFYSLFNVLFLLGYYPEVTYDFRYQEKRIRPDTDYVNLLMEQMPSPQGCTRENEAKIWDWIHANADGEGMLTQNGDTCYGRTVWDVRIRSERPDYRLLKEAMDVPMERVGALAVDRLDDTLNGRTGGEHIRIEVLSKLLVRESTGPAPEVD